MAKSQKINYLFIGILLALILTALSFILMLSLAKYILGKKVLGSKSTSFIDSQNINFKAGNSNLKYFFEPNENSIETYDPSWLGYSVKNTINRDALNERYDYKVEKDIKTFRIITLGDSFTFGHFVNTSENWPEVLEDKLNTELTCKNIDKFEVINLGYPGYDISSVSERYLKRGHKYSPDLVIWLINPWNIDNVNEYLTPAVQELGGKEDFFDPISGTRPIMELAINKIKEKYGDNIGIKFHKKMLDLFFANITSKLLIFTLEELKPNHMEFIESYIKKDSNKYTIIKLFNFHDNPELKLKDEHPNILGHRQIAERLLQKIKSENFLECKVR